MKKKIIIPIVIIIILAIIIAVVGVGLRGFSNTEATDSEIQAQEIKERDLSDSINVNGTVESQNVFAVTSELQAKIEELNVKLGDRVEAGDILCVFDSEDIKRQISTIENQNSISSRLEQQERDVANRELANAKASRDNRINTAQQSLDIARSAYDAAKADENSLPDELAVLQEKYESAKLVLEESRVEGEAMVRSAEDTVNRLNISAGGVNDGKNELDSLKSKLDKTTVRAGQSGIITQLSVEKGSFNSSGSIMVIEDDENLRIKVPIRETDILKLKEGMEAVITCDSIENKEFKGKVSQVINFSSSGATLGQQESGSGGYSAYINIESDSELLLGMSVKVKIVLQDGKKKPAVPYDSIMEDEKGSYVFRATGEGETGLYNIEKIYVNTGISNDYYTEIIGEDIKKGDYIITTPWLLNGEAEAAVVILEDGMVLDELNDEVDR